MIQPLFLFAHGAGAPSSHPWMQRWIAYLSRLGRVHTFDYPYMTNGKRTPDKLPTLIAAHRAALTSVRQGHRGPTVLVGKSMGSRVGCHVALVEQVEALVCLGYPLKGAGGSGPLRDQVLCDLKTPILFVQGTRDPLCPLGLLSVVRQRMTAPNELHVVQSGDHSLEATKTYLKEQRLTQADLEQAALGAIQQFVESRSTPG